MVEYSTNNFTHREIRRYLCQVDHIFSVALVHLSVYLSVGNITHQVMIGLQLNLIEGFGVVKQA